MSTVFYGIRNILYLINKKMKRNILIVLPNDNLGGAEQYLKMVAEYYFKLGYEIHVFF